jgi:hypothetical protein
MPQPFDGPTENNDGQSHDNTGQGTSEADDAPEPHHVTATFFFALPSHCFVIKHQLLATC